jgi:hypothetical protein
MGQKPGEKTHQNLRPRSRNRRLFGARDENPSPEWR